MERMWLFHEDIELLQSLREQVERVCRGDSRKCMPIDISVRSAKAVGAAAPAADPSLPCTSGVVSPLLWNFTGFGKENLVPKLGSFLLHPVLGKMPTCIAATVPPAPTEAAVPLGAPLADGVTRSQRILGPQDRRGRGSASSPVYRIGRRKST